MSCSLIVVTQLDYGSSDLNLNTQKKEKYADKYWTRINISSRCFIWRRCWHSEMSGDFEGWIFEMNNNKHGSNKRMIII